MGIGLMLEVLIKAVLQAISMSIMSIFWLPKVLCGELKATMTKFWWNANENETKIH